MACHESHFGEGKVRSSKWFIVERGHGEPSLSAKAPSEEEKQERNEDLERMRECFFKNLLEDRFTPEEDTLLEAILNYVERWTGRGFAFYQKMCEDPSVRNVKYTCIPPTISAFYQKMFVPSAQYESIPPAQCACVPSA